MNFLGLTATLFLIHGLSLISPGPDFFLVLRNSLFGSRRLGRLSALGVVLGNVFWISIAASLTLLVGEQIGTSALNVLKLLGGLYLAYLGSKILYAHVLGSASGSNSSSQERLAIGDGQAFRMGFLSTVLNGKAAVYFISVVPQFIHPDRSMFENGFFFIEFQILSFAWFFSVAELAGYPSIQQLLHRAFSKIDIAVGGLFTIFGTLLLLEFGRSFF